MFPERSATKDGSVDAVAISVAGIPVEAALTPFDLLDCDENPRGPQWYGSAASRKPSPKKLKARTVMTTLTTGSINQG